MSLQRPPVTILVMLVWLVLVACTTAPTAVVSDAPPTLNFTKNAEGYADISVAQLATILPTEDFTFVNVHIPYEGELPQTDAFIPFDQITDHLDELPAKDAPIVLYCRSGNMSTTAAETLVGLGYTNVIEVDGGFNAWQAAGYEFINNQ